MSEAELEKRIEEIRQAWQILKKRDAIDQLDELCKFMETKELPTAARLFVLNEGLVSLQDVASKHQELVTKVEDSVNSGFSVKCMKEFVQSCETSYYDYPESHQSVPSAPPTASIDRSGQSAPAVVYQAQQPPAPLAYNMSQLELQQQYLMQQQFLQQQILQQQQQQLMMMQTNRASNDAGYGSLSDYQPPQPTAKPRSFSVDLRSERQQDLPSPAVAPKKTPSPKSKPGVFQLFLFPERSQKPSKKQKPCNT